MKQASMNFEEVFLNEWSIFAKTHVLDECNIGLPIREGTQFDGPVRSGDVRLFAEPQRMGLVYKEWDKDRWFILPLSEFSVPASEREAIVGMRVYQFWNALAIPKQLVERSWLVEKISAADLRQVGALYGAAMLGQRLPAMLNTCLGSSPCKLMNPVLDYEMAFLLPEKSFRIRAEKVVVESWAFRRIKSRLAAGSYDTEQSSNIAYREIDVAQTDGYPVVRCELNRPFVSIRKGRDPGALVFTWDGELPSDWNLAGEVRVTAHDHTTRKQIGEGHIDIESHEIIIDDFDGLDDIDRPIKSAGELIIVLSVPRRNDK